MMTRIAALAVSVLLGLWHGPAAAADIVRVETVSGQVLQGRLVSNTARGVVLEALETRVPTTVQWGQVRRFTIIGSDGQPPRAAPGRVDARERLDVKERTGVLRLSGANSMGAQLLPALLADYGLEAGLSGMQEDVTTDPGARVFQLQGAESSRRLRVQVASHGSAAAFSDLLSGQADLGMSTRRVSDAEARGLQGVGGARPDNEHVIGLSGVVMVVHRDNPLRVITVGQLRDLLSGAVARWPGGAAASGAGSGVAGQAVTVYGLDRRSGEYDVVQDRILGVGARLSAQARLFASHEDLADAVAADPAAIGFVGASHTRNTHVLRLEQECGLSGDPSTFYLKTEEYPLSRRLYLYGTGRAGPLARDLLAYAGSARGQVVVDKAGFINLDPILGSVEQSTAQLAAAGRMLPEEQRALGAAQVQVLRQVLEGARRLSVTFRFEAGRADLDARAEADLERLAAWARHAGVAQTALILVGHASIDGLFPTNLDLSRARAHAVGVRLRQMGVTVGQIEGVGPVSQVVCNRTTTESDMNRRVEVWVR